MTRERSMWRFSKSLKENKEWKSAERKKDSDTGIGRDWREHRAHFPVLTGAGAVNGEVEWSLLDRSHVWLILLLSFVLSAGSDTQGISKHWSNEWMDEQCKVSTSSDLKLDDIPPDSQRSGIFTLPCRKGRESWEAIGSYVQNILISWLLNYPLNSFSGNGI